MNSGLKDFLEMFSDILTRPTFDKKYIAEEMNNVNSELKMRFFNNKNNDYEQVIKLLGV